MQTGRYRWLGYGLLLCMALWHGQTLAHSDEYLDSIPAPHGGRVRMAGPLHLEVLATASEVRLYVTDHVGQPLATTGGRAMLRVTGSERSVALTPAGENLFSAPLEQALPADAEWVVFVEMKDTPAQSARYSIRPAAPVPAPDKGDAHGEHHH